MRLAPFVPRALPFFIIAGFTQAPGCAAETDAPFEGSLRRSFPAHAARVLEGTAPFRATDEGFAIDEAEPAGSWSRVRMSLPREGDGRIRVQVDGFAVTVREIGAQGEGRIADRAVAYTRAGGTSYWTAAPSGMEEWLHLEAGQARSGEPVAAWEIEGGTLQDHDGVVTIGDGDGRAHLVVSAPSAFAGGGRPIAARLAVRGARIELRVDPTADEVLIDPLWSATGSLATGRSHFAGALASNGFAVIAGGQTSTGIVATAERYDPATKLWTSAGSISTLREWLTATAIPSAGKILVAGGQNTGMSLTNADLYNPSTNTWSPAAGMKFPRATHAAVLLPNDRVMVTGGAAASEIYDAPTNVWAITGNNVVSRTWCAAASLGGGKVIAAGGIGGYNTSEIYDPATNAWTPGPNMIAPRIWHTMTPFGNGKVLVAGGEASFGGTVQISTEIYDAATNTFTPGPNMGTPRAEHTATTLLNGTVLLAGSYGSTSADLYDPATNTIVPTASMTAVRSSHVAVRLGSGDVLVASGAGLQSAELYTNGLGSPCTDDLQCNSGFCTDGVCCNSACNTGPCDACSIAAGGQKDGSCTLLTGISCEDGDACTKGDTCQTGVCKPGSPVTCPAPDACHQDGKCDSSTGTCSNPAQPNGTACDDGDACTTTDTCLAGACTGGTPVTCPATDACHDPGTCDTKTGTCNVVQKPDGAACDDGKACTAGDTCQAGVCVAGPPVDCKAQGPCENDGACDTVTGACTKSFKPDGTSCPGGACVAGACQTDGGSSSSGGISSSSGSTMTGSGSSSSGSGSSGSSSGSSGDGGSGNGTNNESSGCGCTTAGAPASNAGWLLLGLLGLRRRRRAVGASR